MNETTKSRSSASCLSLDDPLPDILRNGACELLTMTVEIELKVFLDTTAELKLPDGRAPGGAAQALACAQDRRGIGAGEITRPRCGTAARASRPHPVGLDDTAAVGASNQEPRYPAADPYLRGSRAAISRQRCRRCSEGYAELVAFGDLRLEEPRAERVRAGRKRDCVSAALCLRLGRQSLPAGCGWQGVPADSDRRHAGR